jgi:anhydro-N-acetylmuramic acid kinase
MERLRAELAPLAVEKDRAWPADMREAVAFALLGWAHARGIPANLPSVTGARNAVVLGSLTRP